MTLKPLKIKPAPRLRQEDISPKHFKKMDTGSALHVFSYDTSAALRNLVQKKGFSKDLLTTAWFIEKTKRWFDLCSSRCQKTALSLAKPEKYSEAVNFLNEYVKIIREVKIGAKGKALFVLFVLYTGTAVFTDISNHFNPPVQLWV